MPVLTFSLIFVIFVIIITCYMLILRTLLGALNNNHRNNRNHHNIDVTLQFQNLNTNLSNDSNNDNNSDHRDNIIDIDDDGNHENNIKKRFSCFFLKNGRNSRMNSLNFSSFHRRTHSSIISRRSVLEFVRKRGELERRVFIKVLCYVLVFIMQVTLFLQYP